MAGDANHDLFGDTSSSDADTDDLIAAAKSQPIARKKQGAAAKNTSRPAKNTPDADDDDADEPKAGGAGLFDSSSEDEVPASSTKTKTLGKRRGVPKKRPAAKDTRSRKERMAALAKKRAGRGDGGDAEGERPRVKRTKAGSAAGKGGGGDGGYASGDSYDSATIERTRADDDFIDAADEDPDALKELYAEQHFDDERPDGYDSDEEPKQKQKRATAKSSGGGMDKISLSDDEEGEAGGASNALKAACRRMQKAKKEKKSLGQLEEEATTFLKEMDAAADLDAASIASRKPATKRLALLPRVLDTLARKDLNRILLDLDLLSACRRWVEPLPNGALGNVTLRRRLIESLATMTGENGISTHDLKRSGFGKTAMSLYMHRSETPEMKQLLKGVIEQWSRPIFQKSGNMRDLERVQATREANEMGSLGGIARSRQHDVQREERRRSGGKASSAGRGKTADDLKNIIEDGSKATNDLGNNRVRVPYSRGFQYSIRPENRRGDVGDRRNLVSARAAANVGGARESERREALAKRMIEKGRKTNKQGQRSANISIEGRAVK